MKNFSQQKIQGLAQQYGLYSGPNTRSTGADSPRVSYNNLFSLPFTGYVKSSIASTPFPKGWSVTNPTTGNYTITHNLGTARYIIIGSAFSGTFCISSMTSNTVLVQTRDTSNTLANLDFQFILIKSP